MSIAQTTQLLQLLLNSAVMMAIALAWWGVVVVRLGAVSAQMQRLRRQYRQAARWETNQPQGTLMRLRQYRHELLVRYRLTRHSALIMHYVLLVLMASLFSLSLRALIHGNVLITVALFLLVLGAAGILLSVMLALMEFYQLNGLEGRWLDPVASDPELPTIRGVTAPELRPPLLQKEDVIAS
ncbi:MAG: hypothetical protein ACFCVD_18125 [Nodosilinea sp.]